MSRPAGFYVSSGPLTVQASAHAATAGFFWVLNPVSSLDKLCVRRITFQSSPTAITAFASAPRITVERMTFTGTPSGATIPQALRITYDTVLASSATVRSASTGITPVAGPVLMTFIVPPVLTAIGTLITNQLAWKAADNELIVLSPGEGIVVRQADNGTTSDTRRLTVDIACDLAWDSLY